MKRYLKQISIIIFTIFAISMFSGCGSSNKKSDVNSNAVKIGYLSITHALPLYIEQKEIGNNIELIKFGSWPELMEALNSGKIEGASVLIELAMKAKSQGINLKAVALGHIDGNAVVVSKNINSVSDLKGKTFAIPNKLSTHNILLYELLKNENMTFKDLNIVELSPAEMPVALSEKRIDGYCVAEPFGAKAVNAGKGKVLKQSGDIIENSICCALVMRGEFIEENREEAKEVVKGYKEATKFIKENPDETKSDAKKFLKVDKNVIDLSLGWIEFSKLKIEEEDYDKLLDYLNEMNLLENKVSYMDFVDNSLLEEVE